MQPEKELDWKVQIRLQKEVFLQEALNNKHSLKYCLHSRTTSAQHGAFVITRGCERYLCTIPTIRIEVMRAPLQAHELPEPAFSSTMLDMANAQVVS